MPAFAAQRARGDEGAASDYTAMSQPPDDFPELEPGQGPQRTPEDIARAEEVSRTIRGEIGSVPLPPVAEQWEGTVKIILPNGEEREQHIRVPRDTTDTDEDARVKLVLAQIEIETIIAERGGHYETTMDLTDIRAV